MLPLGQLWHSATLRGLVGWLQLRIELLGNFHVGHRQEVTQKVAAVCKRRPLIVSSFDLSFKHYALVLRVR
jgi:hypothetical protein